MDASLLPLILKPNLNGPSPAPNDPSQLLSSALSRKGVPFKFSLKQSLLAGCQGGAGTPFDGLEEVSDARVGAGDGGGCLGDGRLLDDGLLFGSQGVDRHDGKLWGGLWGDGGAREWCLS